MKYPQDILDYQQFTLMEIAVLTVMLLGDPVQVAQWENSVEYDNIKNFLIEIKVLEYGKGDEIILNADRKCNFSILKFDEFNNPVYIHKDDKNGHIKKVLLGGTIKLAHRDNIYQSFEDLDRVLSRDRPAF